MIVLLISLENHRQTEGIQNTNLSFYIYRYLLKMIFNNDHRKIIAIIFLIL